MGSNPLPMEPQEMTLKLRKNMKKRPRMRTRMRRPRPAPDPLRVEEDQKEKAYKFTAYAVIAGAIVFLVGIAVFAITGRPQPAVRIAIPGFWFAFAALNLCTFWTGEYQSRRNGPIDTREQSPGVFYMSAIVSTIVSMSIPTFFLWMAYFGK